MYPGYLTNAFNFFFYLFFETFYPLQQGCTSQWCFSLHVTDYVGHPCRVWIDLSSPIGSVLGGRPWERKKETSKELLVISNQPFCVIDTHQKKGSPPVSLNRTRHRGSIN